MLIPIILSGGAGTRLWPVSRKAHPKPFIKLPDGESLLQKTMRRAIALSNTGRVITVTNRDYYFQSTDQYDALDLPGNIQLDFLLEPCARNTAPAIAMAALYVSETFDRDSTLLILPADHMIERQEVFQTAVVAAKKLASEGYLVTFGIQPTTPDTGFGYIETGEGLGGPGMWDENDESHGITAKNVRAFVEKPSDELAQQYVKSDRFLWNSGMFCFQAGVFLDALSSTAPEIFESAESCWQAMARNGNPVEFDESYFSSIPDISVDYAVMEKADRVSVVACDLGWSDVGNWAAFSQFAPVDESNNRYRCNSETVAIDTHDCFISSENRLVAAVGLNNLMIIDTPDALLVANRDSVQDVKRVVDDLQVKGHDAHLYHQTVHRPWGTYTLLEAGNRFKIKRIEVKPGASLSLQMHFHRSEHWIVVSGTARIINGDEEILLRTNESTYIPAGHHHRLENPGKVQLVLIEVQSGEYLAEDDIVRFEDRYGRIIEG